MITRNCSTAVIFAAVVLSSAILLDAVPVFAQAQSLAASEAATSIAKAKLEAATAAQNAGKKKYPVTRDDMVVAMPVDQAHLTVAHASRVWRKVLQLSLLYPVCSSGCIALATVCMDSLSLIHSNASIVQLKVCLNLITCNQCHVFCKAIVLPSWKLCPL